jgi:hypothetical protein
MYLVVDLMQAATGNRPAQFSGGALLSDVLTIVTSGGVCSQTNPCQVIYDDFGQVVLRTPLKDITNPSSPNAPTTNNEVTINRYRVVYRRTDGRNIQGVDVPYAFDGGVTGTVVTREELAVFFARVPQSTIILVDEAYYHFVDDPHCASACEWMSKQPNVIVVRTFSKVYGMAGMRLGYAIGSKDAIAKMRVHVLGNNSNAAVLEAALVSLSDEDLVPRQRKLNNDTRRWLCDELEKDGYRYIPSQGNFVMIELNGEVQSVVDAFRQRKILVGRQFPSMKNWLRVSIGKPEEMEAFLVGLRTLAPVTARKAA